MKVKQLIKLLQGFSPECEVSFGLMDFEDDDNTLTTMDIESVTATEDGDVMISNATEDDLAESAEKEDDDEEVDSLETEDES